MLGRIIVKEIREHLMSMRFAIACVLCLLVMLSSLLVRSREFIHVQEDYNESAAMARQQIENYRYPWNLVWGPGAQALERPNPLKIFVQGTDYGNGRSFRFHGYVRPISERDVSLTDITGLMFPTLDLVTFVGVIMSLMAIVFGYDAICGEKQSGTLRLMLSYPLPRDSVLIGKWVGGYVMLVLPFVLALVSGALIVAAQTDISLTPAEWIRLATIAGLSLVYVAAFYTLALWVSALTARPSTSIIVLTSIWLVLVLAVPNISDHLAHAIKPSTDPAEMEARRRAAEEEVNEERNAGMSQYDKEQGFGIPWHHDIDWNSFDSKARAYKRWIQECIVSMDAGGAIFDLRDKFDDEAEAETSAHIALARNISRVSPFACFAVSAAELADAGTIKHRRFDQALKQYQRALFTFGLKEQQKHEQYMIDNRILNRYPTWSELRTEPIPRMHYAPPKGSEYMKNIAADVGILAALIVVSFIWAYAAFVRYDVR